MSSTPISQQPRKTTPIKAVCSESRFAIEFTQGQTTVLDRILLTDAVSTALDTIENVGTSHIELRCSRGDVVIGEVTYDRIAKEVTSISLYAPSEFEPVH